MHERLAGADPTRVFSGLEHEYVVPIPGPEGSTLHLGTRDPDADPDGPPAARLLERAAMALGRVLPAARAATSARRRESAPLDQRMARADKLATFGQVAAGVVHELNNPLTSIVAYSEYLIRKSEGTRDADDLERLRRIGEAANRMLRFTRELVSYARPTIGASAPVAVVGIIDRAIAFCEHVLASAGMRVERDYAPEPLTVNAISEQLVQVFVNLITNASQAAPASEGRLVVRTYLKPASRSTGAMTVVVEVEDNGSGIAQDDLHQIFAPFFTTKTENNGTGLGLSIVKGIIESHDGDIQVESQLGRGTRFVIELPALR
jgi:signal transduction histidine kinase